MDLMQSRDVVVGGKYKLRHVTKIKNKIILDQSFQVQMQKFTPFNIFIKMKIANIRIHFVKNVNSEFQPPY